MPSSKLSDHVRVPFPTPDQHIHPRKSAVGNKYSSSQAKGEQSSQSFRRVRFRRACLLISAEGEVIASAADLGMCRRTHVEWHSLEDVMVVVQGPLPFGSMSVAYADQQTTYR
jgi:hypothetical protein